MSSSRFHLFRTNCAQSHSFVDDAFKLSPFGIERLALHQYLHVLWGRIRKVACNQRDGNAIGCVAFASYHPFSRCSYPDAPGLPGTRSDTAAALEGWLRLEDKRLKNGA